MPALQYGIYILISRPRYDEKLKVWFPYASVSWNGDKFHYHQLKDLADTFETQGRSVSLRLCHRSGLDCDAATANHDREVISGVVRCFARPNKLHHYQEKWCCSAPRRAG